MESKLDSRRISLQWHNLVGQNQWTGIRVSVRIDELIRWPLIRNSGSNSMSNTPDTTQPDRRRFGWEQFRFAVAVLLFAAAVVKIFNMQQILTGSGLLRTMPRLVAVAAFEAALATWLIVGNRFLSWLLTLTTFSIFVTSAIYVIATDQSCDCFGEQLDPETMVVIDTVVLLLAVCLRPRGRWMSSRKLIWQLTTVAVIGGLVAVAAVWQYEVLVRIERSRLLVADLLTGKTWPLNEQVDPRLSELSSGKWMILIAQQDCGPCRNLVARHFADPETHRPGERTAVFVFGGGNDRWRFQFDRVTLDLSGDALLGWPNGQPYVVNPAVFLLDNNIVVDAAEGEDTDEFLGSLLSGPEESNP